MLLTEFEGLEVGPVQLTGRYNSVTDLCVCNIAPQGRGAGADLETNTYL